MAMGTDPLVGEEVRATIGEWWTRCVANKSMQEVNVEVQSFRCRKPPKPNKKIQEGAYCKMYLSIRDERCERAIIEGLKQVGAERKEGTAPRGALEREARRLLDKMQK